MTRPSFQWQLHWPTTLFVFAVLPCLLSLGVWQLRRADEKRVVQQQFDVLRAMPPIDAAELGAATPSYTRVRATGALDNARSFLLDNRVSRGRVGFEVITPMHVESAPTDGKQTIVLINRGWIAGDPARLMLPSIPPAAESVTVRGYVYRETENRLLDAGVADTRWPRIVGQINVDAMQAALQQKTLPYVVRLDTDSPAALVAEWPVVTSSPERHTAYAVQWFSMAAVLLALWFWRSCNLRDWLGRRTTL